MRPPIAILAGLIGAGIMAFLCRGMHSEAIAAGLRNPIQQSLTSLGLASAAVDVDGRDVTLRGMVESEAAKLKAGGVAAEELRNRVPENLHRKMVETRAEQPRQFHSDAPELEQILGWIAGEGKFKWRVVNGEFAELKKRGIKKTGPPSHGGSICTAGGLVFMAGTFDKMIRAFDSETGSILWEHELPAGGFATPMTYEANGKQFLVIAAAGGKSGSKANDEFIAFSL